MSKPQAPQEICNEATRQQITVNTLDRARYRYKAGRAYGSADNTIKSAADSVNGAVVSAKAKVESALA